SGLDRASNRGRRSGRRSRQRLCVDGAEASPGFVPSAAPPGDVWGAVLPSSAGGHRVGVGARRWGGGRSEPVINKRMASYEAAKAARAEKIGTDEHFSYLLT